MRRRRTRGASVTAVLLIWRHSWGCDPWSSTAQTSSRDAGQQSHTPGAITKVTKPGRTGGRCYWARHAYAMLGPGIPFCSGGTPRSMWCAAIFVGRPSGGRDAQGSRGAVPAERTQRVRGPALNCWPPGGRCAAITPRPLHTSPTRSGLCHAAGDQGGRRGCLMNSGRM